MKEVVEIELKSNNKVKVNTDLGSLPTEVVEEMINNVSKALAKNLDFELKHKLTYWRVVSLVLIILEALTIFILK